MAAFSLTPTDHSLLNTILYADIFDYPLSLGEIYTRLIAPHPISYPLLLSSLNRLLDHQLLTADSGSRVGESTTLIALSSRSHLFSLRRSRSRHSQAKLIQAAKVGESLKKIPGILGVYLTGSVVTQNADISDDIDIFIITKPNWTWLSRVVINLYLDLKHTRRKPEDTYLYQDKLCLNLFLDQQTLQIKPEQRSLYTANEVILTKPLVTTPILHRQFLHANRWAASFLPHYSTPTPLSSLSNHTTSSSSISTTILKTANNLAFAAQKIYMKSRITRELITPQVAYFHPRDTAATILSKFRQRQLQYKIPTL